MKRLIVLVAGLTLLITVTGITAEDSTSIKPRNSVSDSIADSKEVKKTDQTIVYYLHLDRRCVTCQKLESYSHEAIITGFAKQLKDSTVVWQVENFEKEGNEHFAKDYQLYSQSLILSRWTDGKETEWKNLDKIWQLVGNKEKFIAYVQTEIEKFLKPEAKQ